MVHRPPGRVVHVAELFPTQRTEARGLLIPPPGLRAGRGSEAERESFISTAPLLELMDGIIGSLRMELSPAARERQDLALQGLADTRLTEHFPP